MSSNSPYIFIPVVWPPLTVLMGLYKLYLFIFIYLLRPAATATTWATRCSTTWLCCSGRTSCGRRRSPPPRRRRLHRASRTASTSSRTRASLRKVAKQIQLTNEYHIYTAEIYILSDSKFHRCCKFNKLLMKTLGLVIFVLSLAINPQNYIENPQNSSLWLTPCAVLQSDMLQ